MQECFLGADQKTLNISLEQKNLEQIKIILN